MQRTQAETGYKQSHALIGACDKHCSDSKSIAFGDLQQVGGVRLHGKGVMDNHHYISGIAKGSTSIAARLCAHTSSTNLFIPTGTGPTSTSVRSWSWSVELAEPTYTTFQFKSGAKRKVTCLLII